MNFEKRDIILILGLLFFMIGLTPFTGLFAAALIVIAMYFGIKFYVINRNKSINKELPEGICAECGSKISDQKCPNCDFLNG
jgi:hypothetical protein